MAEINHFLNARGTYVRVSLSTNKGPGVYAIDELDRFEGSGQRRSPILITSVQFRQRDIVSQLPCLDNIKVFYAYGQDFGEITIQGEVLLGPLGDISSEGSQRIMDFFAEHRVSRSYSPIAVSVLDSTYLVYLTGMKIGRINPEFHVMPFSFFGTLWDISRDQVSKLNPAGQILTVDNAYTPALEEALLHNDASPPELTPPQTEGTTFADVLEEGTFTPVSEAAQTGITGSDRQEAKSLSQSEVANNQSPVGNESDAAKRLRNRLIQKGIDPSTPSRELLRETILFDQSNPP